MRVCSDGPVAPRAHSCLDMSENRKSSSEPEASLIERHTSSGIIGSVISENYEQFHLYFNHDNRGRAPGDPIILVPSSITGAIVSVFAGGAFCTFCTPLLTTVADSC